MTARGGAGKARGKRRGLLAGEVERELAVADAPGKSFRKRRGRIFAVGGYELGEGGEQARMGQKIVLDPVEARLGPGFPQIGERDLLLLMLRDRREGRHRTRHRSHCETPSRRSTAAVPSGRTLPWGFRASSQTFRKG